MLLQFVAAGPMMHAESPRLPRDDVGKTPEQSLAEMVKGSSAPLFEA
jgi:hypothetical protein